MLCPPQPPRSCTSALGRLRWEAERLRWPTWPRGQQVVLPGKGAELLWAGGARCSEQGEAQSTESCGLCLAPFLLLPLAASLLHFKEHPQEGFPGKRAAQWRLFGPGCLYSCQADREELTLPTRLLPRPPPAGLAHTLTRSAPLEPGQAGPAAC